jgi:UDP-glucose 4-epimerase
MKILDGLYGKTVVVTGARGYIGSVLVDALIQHSCKVIRVSRVDLEPLADTKTIKGDVRNANIWAEIVAQADVIYHLAGNTSVYEAARNPAESLSSTLLPINHLVKVAQERQCKPRVVFASTATVYGLTTQLPVAENIEPKPITVYDLHKLFAEQQLALATEQGFLDSVSLRLANVYGPSTSVSSADDRGILNRITAMALQGNDLKVYGDGNYLRDYVYIDDVVDVFVAAGLKSLKFNGVFNVGTGNGVTVYEAFYMVADRVKKVTGNSVSINVIPWPDNSNSIERRSYIANIEGLTNALGIYPEILMSSGIDLMIKNFTNNKNK